MKKSCFFFYMLMIIINILPFIPMSIKGILGLVFIGISSIRISLKAGITAAVLWIVLGFINFFLNVNVDYGQGIAAMILGSITYFLTAFYLGSFAEKLKLKNYELSQEIEVRKSAEKAAKEKLTLLQSLMNTIPSPIFFKDLKGHYISCNPAFEAAIDREDILHGEFSDAYLKREKELLDGSSRQTYEEIVRFTDGTLKNVIFDKAIFTDENKIPIGIVGVITDVTDKREAGKLKQNIIENKQMMDKLLENDKAKTEFFSNISHELRTPLNVILGSIQLVELYQRDNEINDSDGKLTKNIKIMKQNCYRLLKLVNNLIDVSKIDARAFKLQLENCNIVSVVEEITVSVSDYMETMGMKLIFDTDIEEKILACDPEKVERILLNLLSNAVKFTPKGGEIRVNIYNNEKGVDIAVEDNGIGIPEDKQDSIFERFCQVDEMFTRQHEGSGIGLSLVKSLVEMHGGVITFKSKVGVGTTFIIHFPWREVKEKVKDNMPLKEAPIERINIEFSDIYSVRN